MDQIEMRIRRILPAHAAVTRRSTSGHNDTIYDAFWELGDDLDPERKHKISKTIEIHEPCEMVEDLPGYTETQRVQVFDRLSLFLEAKYSVFDPSNSGAKSAPAPVEVWIIPPEVWSI